MANTSPATETLSDNTKMNFGSFKVKLAGHLTTDIILKLATLFMFTPAAIDELRQASNSPEQRMVSLMEEKGQIKPNDISPLLTALDKLGLHGLLSTMHDIIPGCKDFGRFKVQLAELLTTENILKLATFFVFTPAEIDELRHAKKSPGLLMVSLMEERGQIKPNDISPLLTALDQLGLTGLLRTLRSIFQGSEDKTCLFVRYLKSSYKQLYSKINPIHYIREKVFRVNDIFVEGGIEMHGRDNKGSERPLEGKRMEAVKLNSYRDVFNDDIISSKRILLEGDPGYGKSTLTLQAAYDWCNASDSSPLKDVSIFILLPLRLLNGILSICLAIKLILMPDESNLTEEDIMEILRNSPGAVLVFDGYDEYPDKDNIEISQVMKIIAGNMFANLKVITCTRSSYIPDNLDVETVYVRLTGFDDNARDEYIRRAVSVNDNQAVRRINDLLTSNPVLGDICQVPLFCVMFVHISCKKESVVSFVSVSVTFFFRHILTCFYEHMWNKMGHARKPNDRAIIPDYPKLNKLLYDSLTGKNQQIVWQKDTFKTNVGDGCYNELISIGILIEEDILKINDTPGMAAVSFIERTTVVRFFYKLFAEWYAANYLSTCAGSMEHGPLRLRKVFEKINPVDLPFVFRFACGLNKKASSRIIKYLKGMEGGQSFAILCFPEQVSEPDDEVAIVKDLLTGGVTIRSTDSRFLQRLTIQILEIAAKSDIPITSVCLNKSFKECDEDVIVLHSGLRLNQLLTVEKIHIETEQVNTEPRILTEEDVTMMLRYGLRSEHLKELSFDNCLLPPSIASESIPAGMKSRDIKVSWGNYGYSLNLQSGAWKVDDVDTVRRLCKDVCIGKTDSVLLQRCTIQLLGNASYHDIPISVLGLRWPFIRVDKGGIMLQSGLYLPTLSTLEKLKVNAKAAELTEEDVIGLLNYGVQSRRFKELKFYRCKLPTSISPEMIPETARSRNIRVLWLEKTSQLDLQSGKWKQAEDIQTITELCSNAVIINNGSSQESQKSTIELLKKASRHDIPIHSVVLAESFNKVNEDDITLYSGLSLPILTSLERMYILTEDGREMNKHEVNGILNYLQHSQRFKYLSFGNCLLPPIIASSSLANLKARIVYVFWIPYGLNERHYLLDLQSGCWLLNKDPESFFPMLKCGEELTDADYANEVEAFRNYFSDQAWQLTYHASFYQSKLTTSTSPDSTAETATSSNIKVLWPENIYQHDLQSGKWKQGEDIQTITELCSNAVVINNESSQESQKSTIELLKKASRHDIPIFSVVLAESFNKVDEDDITLYSGLSLPILTSIERMSILTENGREMNKHEVNGILNYLQHSQRFKQLYFGNCLLPPIIASSSLANLKARNVYVFWIPYGVNERHFHLDLQSGRWLLNKDPESFFPMLKRRKELTDADYAKEASILTFSDLKEELSSKLTQTDCANLGRYFSLPPDQVQTIITSTLYSKNFLLALEERGYIHPSNVNRLTDALTELKINHTYLLETYMKLRDQETEYDRFLAGLSAHLTFSITVKLCDNFEVTDKKKEAVISSQNPGLSFLQTIDEMGTINPSDVSKLKTPLEEYHLVQAVAKIHEYQSLVLSDETMAQDEGKENLFIKSLQQKMKSWFETMTPVPWKKSCQWKSNDLFIASGLVLTNSGSKISSREVDQKCKLHYRDIFTHERLKEETRIILEGQPGSGKTMLSSQLAYDWCCGKLMDIPMVIYLPLKIVDNMTIYQAIKMFYIRKGIPITEEDIESMLNSGKKKVYLILDGLEEYNGVTKDGGLSEVMRVMTKEKLSNCIVIVTARTDYTKHLPPGPMLTIGSFGEDERNEYIEKVYSDYLKKQEEVKELIKNVPFIPDICNVPLLFVLLVHNIDRLGKLQGSQLDRVTPFVKAIVDILCSVQDDENTSGHLSYQQQEYTSAKYVSVSESVTSINPQDTFITLEELAFNGLCKGNQQLFWHKDFVDRCVRNSKAWIDAGLLVVEEGTPFNSSSRDLQTDSGSESSQTDSISDESLNTSNVTSEIKKGLSLDPEILGSLGDLQTVSRGESPQTDSIGDTSLNTSNVTSEIKKGVSLEPDLLESINQSKNKPILESKEKKSELSQKRKAAKYVSLQVKFLHKLIQEWFAAKHLALLFWGYKLTENHYKYQLFRKHLANIDPADLHYVLRFTCHICPPSFHVIASFLMRDFKTEDCEIPDYIMNCICLCFAEYDGYKGHKIKDIVNEVCRRESVNFSSEDSRLLLRSKVSMLTFASRSQIPIKCLKLSDVVEKVTEKAVILSDVSLGVLKTLRAIEVNRWDLKLIKQDYEHLIKFIINNEMVEVACLLFPSPPVAVKDEKDLNNLQSRNISVKWIIGANLIHTLNVTTGEWMMEFRLPGRMSATSSSLKPISDNLPSNPLQMELWINEDGGVLELPDTGVSLDIPPGALEKDQLIQMRVIPYNFQRDSDLSFSSNSSVVVELLPSNLKLLKPVNLTLPHCLVLKRGCEWKAKIYSSHHEEGNQPVWRPQPDTPYVLTERNCLIKLNNFSWETFDIGDEIVEGKHIVLYAAKDLSSSESITQIHVGYYWDLPGGEEIVRLNAVSVLVKQYAVFLKKGNLPLTCQFDHIEPPDWTHGAEGKKTKEISFKRVATTKGGFCKFVLNIKEGTQERHVCRCYFEAGQGSELAELLFILKGGEEDSAASSSDKLVDAGLSQSQKKTCDESLTGKHPLENIDLEVKTESMKDLEASSLSDSSVPSKSDNVLHSEKRCIDESTDVMNPSLPSHQAIRGEAKGNPTGAEAMTKDSEVVTNETLQDLSGNLTEEWRDVGRKLKLEETDLCNIEANNRNKGQKEVIYQVLLLWKQKHGMAATNKALIDALRVAGRKDLHDNFLKFGKFGSTSIEDAAKE